MLKFYCKVENRKGLKYICLLSFSRFVKENALLLLLETMETRLKYILASFPMALSRNTAKNYDCTAVHYLYPTVRQPVEILI